MDEFRSILYEHAKKYPQMQPQDAVKLVYQNEFGCGHMVTDAEESMRRLREEYRALHDKKPITALQELPTTEAVGNGWLRIDLNTLNEKTFPLWAVNKMLLAVATAEYKANNRPPKTAGLSSFLEKLEILKDETKKQIFTFTEPELEDYLSSYLKTEKDGKIPPVSHSARYKELYHPAYRLVSEEYEPLFATISKIYLMLKEKGHINIAIEGRAASGKSTAARRLDDIFDVNIIHTDDFFLPEELRTKERYEEAGGNFHYERFCEEVVQGIRGKCIFTYRIFDCKTMSYTRTVTVVPRPVTIVEGAYSMHPNIGNIYDLHIFMTALKREQNMRILKRDGEEVLKQFIKTWVPLENRYFEAFSIREHCDIVIMNAKEAKAGMGAKPLKCE